MWIFLNDSFVSVVQHPTEPTLLVVRARRRGDLQALLGPRTRVLETLDSDYQFRAFASKDTVASVLANRVRLIDYGNFKDSVKDPDRKRRYLNVWTEMWEWQWLHASGGLLSWRKLFRRSA